MQPLEMPAPPSAARVRDAVAGVLRDARDAPDEPFEGELALALVLHAWAHMASTEPEPFAVVARGPQGAAYEAVSVDVFAVDALASNRLDEALDALLAHGSAIAGAVALPVALAAERAFGWPTGVLVRTDDGTGDRCSIVLLVDRRSRGWGCMAKVEMGPDGVLRPATERGTGLWCALPEGFVELLGGWAPDPSCSSS